jgi:peptidoglycan/xylan/chitin deacetylase (PgdA/CDA1 family)
MRGLSIPSWPNGKRAAVCLTCDIDRRDYAADGRLERVLDLLDHQKLKSTFFIPAETICQDPAIALKIVAQGSEVAGHGDTHRGYKAESYREQASRISRMRSTIQDLVNVKVEGFRAPYLLEDTNTIKAANDLGFSYDSSITCREAWRWNLADRLRRTVRNQTLRGLLSRTEKVEGSSIPGQARPVTLLFYEACFGRLHRDDPFHPMVNGKRLRILEIPMSNRDDHQLINVWPRYRDWRKLSMAWQEDFNRRCRRNGLYVLLFHVQLTGAKRYIRALEDFIQYTNDKNAWVPTLSKLAEWWRTRFSSGEQGAQIASRDTYTDIN